MKNSRTQYEDKTKEQLINELTRLRQRISELESLENERKRTEDEFCIQQEKFEGMLAAIGDGVDITTYDYRVVYANDNLKKIIGKDELEGHLCYEVFLDRNAPCKRCPMRRAIESGRTETEEILQPNKKIVELSVSPLRLPSGEMAAIEIAKDITERKQAEEALREARNYLENLFNYANAPIIVWDSESKITRFNHAFEHLTGYIANEVIGQKLHMLFPEANRNESLSKIARALNGEYWESVEIPILHKNGDIRIALWNSANIYTESKTLLATIVQGQDITERKRAEEALREAYEKLEMRVKERTAELARANEELRLEISERKRVEDELRIKDNAIESSINGIGIADLKGYLTYANNSFFKMWGYDKKEALRKHIENFCHIKEEAVEVIEALKNKGGWIGELKARRKDGSLFDIEFSASVVKDEAGNPICMMASFVDITDRRQAEETLRRSNEFNRSIIESCSDCIKVLDIEGRLQFMSRGGQQLMEIEDIGQYLNKSYEDFWKGSDYQGAFDAIAKARKGRVANFSGYCPTADGFPKWWDVVVSPIFGADGKVDRLLSVSRDVTKRKQVEEDLKKVSDELARSNADLQQFAYAASHDLQEPLRGIEGFVKLLTRRYKGKFDTKADEFFEYIVDGVKRMQMLIKDMLAYSQVGTKGKRFNPTECSSILAQALTDLQAAIEESGTVVTHDDLPTIMADASQLSRVLQNLIGNAIKFRGEEAPRVHVSAERKGDEWVFSIRDNGIGIDPKDAERIFIIFQRLHDRAEYPGSGMGLALCKRIVERHGGRIWVESEHGRGSTFFFTVPSGE